MPASTVDDDHDATVMMVQQVAAVQSSALQYPLDEGISGVLPSAAARAGKILAFDSLGKPIPAVLLEDSSADVRLDLATTGAGKGAEMVAFKQSGAGAVARTVDAKMRESVSVKDFGAVGDGVTDDTAAIQAAVNKVITAADGGYSLTLPEGVYRLTAPITVTGSLRVVGEGAAPYANGPGTRGAGSWLHFDHSGRGLVLDGAGPLAGIELEKFGTFRNQPEPYSGWTPAAHDWDVYINSADVKLTDMVLLNPTKGVQLTNGNYGRLYLSRLRMHAFDVGINVEESYDVVYMDQVHIWPFWKDSPHVWAYTLANLDAIKLGRADNPMLSNIFTIFAHRGLRMYQAAAGKTSKLHLVNADFDRGHVGILVDSTEATGQFTNITVQGETGRSGTRGVQIEGSGNKLDFVNLDIKTSSFNAFLVAGTATTVRVSNFSATTYDQAGVGYPAIEVLSGNTFRFAEVPMISGGRVGPYFGGSGTIRGILGEGSASPTTDSNGDAVITHNLGANPSRIFVQLKSNSAIHWTVKDKTSTTFTVRFFTPTGAALTNTPVAFDWHAGY